jgi:hypothetical protein
VALHDGSAAEGTQPQSDNELSRVLRVERQPIIVAGFYGGMLVLYLCSIWVL